MTKSIWGGPPPSNVSSFEEKLGLQPPTPESDLALEAKLNHYDAIISSASDAIMRKSLDGTITGWSHGAEIIFGYSRAEMIGQSIQRILPADRFAEESPIIARVKRGEAVKPFDTVRVRKDSESIHVSISIFPILDDHGKITGVSTIARDITERIEMERELLARERELYSLAEAMPQIVWVTRADGWNTYFNQQWVKYTGLSLAESRGNGWIRPFHPDDQKRAWEGWQTAVNHGSTYSFECGLRRADGAYQWWLVRGAPFLDEAGKISKWHGTFTDIQDMKEAEFEIKRTRQILAESESQFRGAFETAAHGMALVSTKGNFIKANQALCDLVGYTEDELLQTRFQDITHPDDLEGDLTFMQALLQGEINSYQMEKRYLHRRRGIVWVLLSVSLARSSTGIPIHFVAHSQDIGQRRAAEQTLQEASDLLDAAPDAMIAVGMNGIILFANHRTEAVFGYAKDELLGLSVELLIPERLREKHPVHITTFFATPKVRPMGANLCLLARRRDGGEFSIEVSLSPVVINGEPLVMAAVRDITARTQLEEMVEATRAQITASSRLAAVGEMAGGIAHEINNPLAVIHALASDLVEQGDATPEELRECGERIVGYADRITKIIRSLRHIARDGERDPFDEASVGKIVELTLDLCQERFRQHTVDLSTSPIEREIRILCREVQISQTLVNLLQNAFDAAEEQDGERWVRLEVVTQDDRVILSVIDSGKGVPPDLKERIMEPFFTTKPVGKGTGLGLSLSRQIAKEHGGTLELTEKDGHTCFSLCLPALHHGRPACS